MEGTYLAQNTQENSEIYTLNVFNTITKKYEDIEVTKEVYETYMRTKWGIENNNSSFYDHEIQLSGLIGGENENYENFREFVDDENTPENIILDQNLHEILREAIHRLNSNEADLVEHIFFEGMSETRYAERIGVSVAYICKLKKKIMKKFQKILR